MSDTEWLGFPQGVHGGRLDLSGGRPEGVVALLNREDAATEKHIAGARRLGIPERAAAEFSTRGPAHAPDRIWADNEGREYRRCPSPVWSGADPADAGIAAFIQSGWQLVLLRERGNQGVVKTKQHGFVTSERLR